jgi:hypothetical protein
VELPGLNVQRRSRLYCFFSRAARFLAFFVLKWPKGEGKKLNLYCFFPSPQGVCGTKTPPVKGTVEYRSCIAARICRKSPLIGGEPFPKAPFGGERGVGGLGGKLIEQKKDKKMVFPVK